MLAGTDFGPPKPMELSVPIQGRAAALIAYPGQFVGLIEWLPNSGPMHSSPVFQVFPVLART
jgi:hypothetical protein